MIWTKGLLCDRWYFHPVFFVRLLWTIFSVVVTGVIILYITSLYDSFFPKVVTSTPAAIFFVICALFILIFTFSFLVYTGFFEAYRNLVVFILIGASLVFLIICIIFTSMYGQKANQDEYTDIIIAYINDTKNQGEAPYKWFYSYVITPSYSDLEVQDAVATYAKTRSRDAGNALLGTALTWAVFDICFVALLFWGDDYAKLREEESVVND